MAGTCETSADKKAQQKKAKLLYFIVLNLNLGPVNFFYKYK